MRSEAGADSVAPAPASARSCFGFSGRFPGRPNDLRPRRAMHHRRLPPQRLRAARQIWDQQGCRGAVLPQRHPYFLVVEPPQEEVRR
jgi:hypothetical protein